MKFSFQKLINGYRVLNSPSPGQNFRKKLCEVVEKKFLFPKTYKKNSERSSISKLSTLIPKEKMSQTDGDPLRSASLIIFLNSPASLIFL